MASERERLRPSHQSKPKHGTRLSAVQIHDNILASATVETERHADSLFWSALTAGLVIGFSFLGGAYASTLTTNETWKKALVAAAYPIGFIFVVIGRMELFTENTLDPVIPFLHERSRKRLRGMLRLWAILLAGNLLGAAIFGALLALTPVVPHAIHESLVDVATASTSDTAGAVAYRSIFAGWLMALMSWLLGSTTARGPQMTIVWLCAAPIGAFDFRHSIAGAVEVFFRLFAGNASASDMIFGFLLPSIVGNTIGGVVLVALLNFAQVRSELPAHPQTR